MKKNMGNTDKFIRSMLVALLLLMYFTHVVNGTLAIITLVAAAVLTVTIFLKFCPLYAVLGIKTCYIKKRG
jgi:hypothetical protein